MDGNVLALRGSFFQSWRKCGRIFWISVHSNWALTGVRFRRGYCKILFFTGRWNGQESIYWFRVLFTVSNQAARAGLKPSLTKAARGSNKGFGRLPQFSHDHPLHLCGSTVWATTSSSTWACINICKHVYSSMAWNEGGWHHIPSFHPFACVPTVTYCLLISWKIVFVTWANVKSLVHIIIPVSSKTWKQSEMKSCLNIFGIRME